MKPDRFKTTEINLPPSEGADGVVGLQWSPDSTLVAFTYTYPSGTFIYVAKPDRSEITKLIPFSCEFTFMNPSWSPNGTKIASRRTGISTLWR